jgi:site-specific recombinase XerD
VSTGARASELLGATCGDLDAGSQLVTVIRKGTRAMQPLPASPDAFVWLRLYQAEFHGLVPEGRDDPLWWTLRRPFRQLTYHAARAMFTRAGSLLGANWSLHDLRHTAAYRMARDEGMPLTDVQWILGHAQLTTTQIYTSAPLEETIASVLAHHARRAAAPSLPAGGAPEYRSESLDVLFPGGPR